MLEEEARETHNKHTRQGFVWLCFVFRPGQSFVPPAQLLNKSDAKKEKEKVLGRVLLDGES